MNNYKIKYLILPNGKAPIIDEKAQELLEQWRIKKWQNQNLSTNIF